MQVAELKLVLLDIKPANILVRKFDMRNLQNYPDKGAAWNAARWGKKVDIRLADFDARASAAHRSRFHKNASPAANRLAHDPTPPLAADFTMYVPDMDPPCLELIMLTLLEGTLFCLSRSSGASRLRIVLPSSRTRVRIACDLSASAP